MVSLIKEEAVCQDEEFWRHFPGLSVCLFKVSSEPPNFPKQSSSASSNDLFVLSPHNVWNIISCFPTSSYLRYCIYVTLGCVKIVWMFVCLLWYLTRSVSLSSQQLKSGRPSKFLQFSCKMVTNYLAHNTQSLTYLDAPLLAWLTITGTITIILCSMNNTFNTKIFRLRWSSVSFTCFLLKDCNNCIQIF